MRINDGFDDGKPQPSTIPFALSRWVDAVEAVEQSGKVFSRDCQARVLYRNGDCIPVPAQGYMHGLALWGVPDGIRDEVAERPPQQ